ncbi:MAG: AcrR family transcriptional regulator [Bacteroidia bacterium]|jgi:AcrR family transcriptional regulator
MLPCLDIDPAIKLMKSSPQPLTPLERDLQGVASDKPTPISAFALASKLFAKGRRVDMVQLAEGLSVSRATLYRWVGSREALLTEVVWAGAREMMDKAEAQSPCEGGEYLAEVISDFVCQVVRQPAMNAFLEREGEAAMRLLTLADGGFQLRVVGWAKELIEAQVGAGKFTLTLPSEELAFAVVRLGESYIYRRFITGKRPDTDSVLSLMKLLLR